MSPGCVNVLMHHGGSFSKEDALSYDGGEVCLFRNIEKDVMSYFHVVQLAKSVGFKDGDTLFYGIPGRSLEATIDQLIDDASVSEMMKYADQTNFLEIYIQHNEHYGSNSPTDADPSQPDTINELNKVSSSRKLNKRDKKIWTAEEEMALIDILYEMNDSGWKAGTGHKCGYLTYIEKELAKKLPNAKIKADPHIQSKVKTMEKLLSYVLDIQQNGSGFGWDDERKMVIGDKKLFLDWAKSRPGAAGLYMKPFVNFDKLCEIYASDLAKGAKAKGPGDPFEMHEEQSSAHVTEAEHQTENDVDSHSHQPCHGSNPSNGGKSASIRKRMLLDDNTAAVDFSSVAKSLKILVDVETSNAAAYGKELEARKQTTERRDQLFNVLAKYNDVYP
ncbi:hypothetical protein BS78_02G027700 [Paspalum vaginatum]|nr:hypothetical protein BS78_02G027700 [Paspalum vaginatum]